MPSSPLMVGQRVEPPVSWARTQILMRDASAWGLAPVTPGQEAYSYPTTFHHNCPWKTLRDGWNVLYTFCSAEAVKDVFYMYWKGNMATGGPGRLIDKLLAIKEAVGPTKETAASGTYELWMDRMTTQMTHLSVEKQLTVDDDMALCSMAAWQAWNIVEGSKESVRIDDPGSDGFDDFRNIKRSLDDRFAKVLVYHNALEALIGNYNNVKASACSFPNTMTWDRNFKIALDLCRGVASEKLVPFDKEFWKKAPKLGKKGAQTETITIDTKPMYFVARNLIGQV